MAGRSTAKSTFARITKAPRPNTRQALTLGVLAVLSALVLWRVAGLVGEFREVRAKRAELEAKRAELEERHRALEEEAQFVADPDHLEQELRSRYNYKTPNQKVIVIVPPATSTTSTNP